MEKIEIGRTCSTMKDEERCIQGFGGKTLLEREHLEDPGLDGRIIISWVFRKWNVFVWTGLIRLRIGTGGGEL